MRPPRTFRGRLAAITGLGAVVRLAVLAYHWRRPLMPNDSLWYSAIATGLRHGHFFRPPAGTSPAEHGPLTPLLMTPLSFLSDPLQGQRLTTTLCGIASVALVGLLARRIGGDRLGLLAAAIAALYPNMWVHDGLVMAEAPAILLVLAFMLALLHLLDRQAEGGRSWPSTLAVGALCGLAALTRSELLLLAPGAAVVLLLHRRRWATLAPAVLVVVGAMATIMPWTAVNLTRFDRPVLLSTNDGTTLLGSYCDDIFYGSNKGGWSLFCVLDPAKQVPGDFSVRSAQWRRWALEYARDHERDLPGVVAARVGRALDVFGLNDLVIGDRGEEKPAPVVWSGIVCWWLLAPLAVFGALRVRRRDRAVLLLPVVTVAVTTVVFYGHHRLRATLEPSVVIFAAVAINGLLRRWWPIGPTSADDRGDHAGDAVDTGVGEAAVG